MKRLVLAACGSLFFVSSAQAAVPTPLVQQYLHHYHLVRHTQGANVAGCNLIEKHGSCHIKATVSAVEQSDAVLQRDLAPPAAVHTSSTQSSSTPVQSYSSESSQSSSGSSGGGAASSSLESCVIQHESSGNPQEVTGQYAGIGQWSPDAWAQDGGLKYAGSPTGASYSQQEQVLSSEGDAGMRQQQGQFDGCS